MEARCVANLDDVNWLDYGGCMVYTDDHMELIEEAIEDGETELWTVWHIDIDRLKLVDGHLVDLSYEADWGAASVHDVWFARYIDSAATISDRSAEDLRNGFCSSNVRVRADAYLCMTHEVGAYELGSASTYSRKEMKRYGKANGYVSRSAVYEERSQGDLVMLAVQEGDYTKAASLVRVGRTKADRDEHQSTLVGELLASDRLTHGQQCALYTASLKLA